MPFIPLDIPAGVYRNGTDYQSKGRWRDTNLVRWVDNSMRPVGGWNARTETVGSNPMRGSLAWRDNSLNRYLVSGSADSLVTYLDDGTLVDITPADLGTGIVDASISTGYGAGSYGVGLYNTPRPDSIILVPATSWTLDNWGEYLVACHSGDGRIFEWQLDRTTPAAAVPLANAPTGNNAVIVTAERFVFALGASNNPRLVAWSDREDNTTWSPLGTNEAGSIELQTNGNIVCGEKVQGQTLILTDVDAHVATYIGGQFVYGFERVGTACGVVSTQASATTPAGCFWMGKDGFFAYSGGSVQQLQSGVEDYVFSNINNDQISKVAAVVNGKYNEIWWFYPSSESQENDQYVAFNYRDNIWFTGYMGRTTGVDSGAYMYPIYFCSTTNRPFDHEYGFDYHNVPKPWAETGAIEIGSGDSVMKVVGLIPDERNKGDVTVSFKARFYPNGQEYTYGSYPLSSPTSVRFTGRQITVRIDGETLDDWRVGQIRLDAVAGGRR